MKNPDGGLLVLLFVGEMAQEEETLLQENR